MWVENDDLIEMREALEKFNALLKDGEETTQDIIKKCVLKDDVWGFREAMETFTAEMFVLAGQHGSVKIGADLHHGVRDRPECCDDEAFTGEFKEMIKKEVKEWKEHEERLQKRFEEKRKSETSN